MRDRYAPMGYPSTKFVYNHANSGSFAVTQSPDHREFDIIVYGATGFTGQQAVQYLAQHAPPGLKWAIAGRNSSRLESIRSKIDSHQRPQAFVADALDHEAIDKLCQRTRVMLTTAGPFARYGRILVDRCVHHKVHYVDITGETAFVADVIEQYHQSAQRDGTCIIPCCGFDSVPSDLGVWYMVESLKKQGVNQAGTVSGAFLLRGGLNGGTVASGLAMGEDNEHERMDDVLLLNPKSQRSESERNESQDVRWPHFQPILDTWLAPFIMAPINTRIVRRTNALLTEIGDGYGAGFRYHEYMECRAPFSFLKSLGVSLGLRLTNGLFRTAFGRRIIRWVTPKPGHGPSVSSMDGGFFRGRFVTQTPDNRRVITTVSSDGDQEIESQ